MCSDQLKCYKSPSTAFVRMDTGTRWQPTQGVYVHLWVLMGGQDGGIHRVTTYNGTRVPQHKLGAGVCIYTG